MSDEGRLIAGRYRVIASLGRGGMGVVWLAYDERLHRKVAVKQLLMPTGLTGPQAEQANRRAMREGRIAAKLQHPHVTTVYDVLEADGRTYLIMEYVPSTSLSHVLAERGTLPLAQVARVGAQAATALAAAHASGVVHRDVKPGNVLLSSEGAVKITDFGVSRVVEDFTATTTGMIAGTPAYLSPEVAQGQPATFASDVFSLGATLYAAIEGGPPYGSSDNAMALLYRAASGQVTPPTRAGTLTEVLVRMLNVDPAGRPTMTEVSDALAAMDTGADGASPASRDAVEPSAVPAGNRRRKGVLIATAVTLLVLAGSTLLALALNSTDPDLTGTAPSPAPPMAPPATTTSSTRPAAPLTFTSTSASPSVPRDEPRTLSEVVAGYYALMPNDLRDAWTWLTPKYQDNPAGGYGGYQAFWNRIRAVRASGVTALPGDRVEATVEYTFTDGRVVRERHRYRLVRQDGRWKIAESTVLSSMTL